jgi:hypothetical protein
MQREILRERDRTFRQRLQARQVTVALDAFRPVIGGVLAPVHRVFVADHAQRGTRLLLASVEALPVLLDDGRGLFLAEHVLRGKLLRVQLARRGVLADHLVHHRLRGGRFVRFVVAVAAITDQIDDHVLAEALAVRQRQARDEHHGFRIVAVDVEDRRLEHLRDVGAIHGGPHVILA